MLHFTLILTPFLLFIEKASREQKNIFLWTQKNVHIHVDSFVLINLNENMYE